MGILDGIFGGGEQQVTQKVTYPKWYTEAAKDLIQYGNNAGEWLAQPYQGNTVAGFDPLQQQAMTALGANMGSTNAAYDAAKSGTAGVMNYTPQMVGSSFNPTAVQAGTQNYDYTPSNVSGGSFLQGDVGAYMDPYVQNVERQALGRLEDQRLQAQNSNADMARNSGAFGGSRHGLREALTDVESARSAGELSSNLRSQAYNNAANLMQQDMGRNMQAQLANQQAGMQNAQFGANIGLQNISNNLNAQQYNSSMGYNAAQLAQQAALANQQAGLSGAQLNLGAANQYGNLATNQQNAFLQGVQGAMSAGGMNQQYQQSLLNQQQQQYNDMRNYPLEIMNTRIAALSGTQVPQTTTGTTSGGGGLASGIMGGLGGALTGASMFGAGGALAGLGGVTAGGGAGIGALLGLLGGLSDENEKTNIEKLGKDPDTGLNLYAYDYKADVKAAKKNGTPLPMKRVGPMAQEIEEKYPGSTRKVGGKMVVANLGFGG